MSKITLYLIILLLLFILLKSVIPIQSRLDVNINITYLILSLVFTTIIYLLILHKCKCKSVESFSYETTPQKLCEDPYTYTSNDEKRKFCSQFTPEEIRKYHCSKGFNGRPVRFEYTSMSDSNWNNTMCSNFNPNINVL